MDQICNVVQAYKNGEDIKMADGPTSDGLVNWLIYLVLFLVTGFFGFIQKHFSGRLAKLEERCESTTDAVHSLEQTLTEKMNDNNTAWGDKFEDRRKENKKDFKDLHTKIDTNQDTILRELRKIKP